MQHCHLEVATVSPDGAIVDVDLRALGDEVATQHEVTGGEVRKVEGASKKVAITLFQHGHEIVKLFLKT